MPLGLYLDIPFCSAICNYCNFNRGLFDGPLKDRYVAALEDRNPRRRRRAPDRRPTRSGGGRRRCSTRTRSLRLIHRMSRTVLAVSPDAESRSKPIRRNVVSGTDGTVFAPPVSIASASASSRSASRSRAVGRIDTTDRAVRAIEEARAAGLRTSVSDLMMRLLQQSRADWQESVERVDRDRPRTCVTGIRWES